MVNIISPYPRWVLRNLFDVPTELVCRIEMNCMIHFFYSAKYTSNLMIDNNLPHENVQMTFFLHRLGNTVPTRLNLVICWVYNAQNRQTTYVMTSHSSALSTIWHWNVQFKGSCTKIDTLAQSWLQVRLHTHQTTAWGTTINFYPYWH